MEGVGPERAVTIAAELVDLAPVIGKLTARGVNMTEPGGGPSATSTSASAAASAPAGAATPLLPLRKPTARR